MYKPTELCLLAQKYGADKCPAINHSYTPFYYEFLKDRRHEVTKVFEMGVGNFRQFKHIPNYTLGASLYMWRDFFPNAQIYGGDIESTSVFKTDRIETFQCDETKVEDLEKLVEKVGADFDIFIDDASHHFHDQIFLFEFFMPRLPQGSVYIIEDIGRPRRFRKMYEGRYDVMEPSLLPVGLKRTTNHVVVIRHKR